MTVRSPMHDVIALEGDCASEEAETLLQLLLAAPTAIIDLRRCNSAHTAVIQVIMAAQVRLRPPDRGGLLRTGLASLAELFITN